jgi:hypothetical protein
MWRVCPAISNNSTEPPHLLVLPPSKCLTCFRSEITRLPLHATAPPPSPAQLVDDGAFRVVVCSSCDCFMCMRSLSQHQSRAVRCSSCALPILRLSHCVLTALSCTDGAVSFRSPSLFYFLVQSWCRGFVFYFHLITLRHTPQSVGLLWTRDRPVAETST